MPRPKTVAFTIVARNYGAFALTLMQSLRDVHPEWDRVVGLVDRCDAADIPGQGLFETILVESLPLPDKPRFLFRYGVMELSTAVKPWMFEALRARGYERVVYLDPDILVLDRLEDVERLLDEGAAAVVTPHLTAPMEDDYTPGELEIMRAGAYNLGFLAVRACPAADDFVAWWQRKLEHGAAVDLARGLFTDQKWIDLAPGMFGGFAILRDAGYNLAYWNLAHRPVTCEGGVWRAGGAPVRFVHFSGFDPQAPQRFSKHQDRFRLDTVGPLRELALEYARRVLANGHAEMRRLPYAFGRFDDGTAIIDGAREIYRENPALRERAGADPFAAAREFLRCDPDMLPVAAEWAWRRDPYIQAAFPNPKGASREGLLQWLVGTAGRDLAIDDAYLAPIREELVARRKNRAREAFASQSFPPVAVDAASLPVFGRLLLMMHRRLTGGALSLERLQQYREARSPVAFLRIGIEQFRRTHWARRLGLPPLPPETRSAKNRLPMPMAPLPHAGVRGPGRSAVLGEWVEGLTFEPHTGHWWLGTHGRIAVGSPPAGTLRVEGLHMAGLMRRKHGDDLLTIQVEVDHEPVGAVALVAGGRFDVSLALPEGRTVERFVLGLVPDRWFVPAEVGEGADERKLSAQIERIELDGRSIFPPESDARPTASAEAPVPGVNVIGYLRSEHGVGQSARLFVGALDAAGIDSALIDFNEGNLSRTGDRSFEARLRTEPAHRINVFHINADQMPLARARLPLSLFDNYNIGFWHWELPELPDEYLSGFYDLEEVWVPSAFVQDAIAKKSPVPVVRMPHAIRFEVSGEAERGRFGLPADRFLFLLMYDFSSYQERKNPRGALEAFDRAFGAGDGRAALVVKTNNAHLHPEAAAELRDWLAGRDNVIWIDRTMTRQQVYDLVAVCDALLSLHRSEGYGLGPAEAMYLGKPVVATHWSGNTEFMRSDNSLPVNYRLVTIARDLGVYKAGQQWAEPDAEHAAAQMRRVLDDRDLRERISREAMRTMREEFSPEAVGRRIRDRLRFIGANLIGH